MQVFFITSIEYHGLPQSLINRNLTRLNTWIFFFTWVANVEEVCPAAPQVGPQHRVVQRVVWFMVEHMLRIVEVWMVEVNVNTVEPDA